MKVALLLPGYLDSPDYLHMKIFEKRLQKLGYFVERLDPCNLWKTKNIKNYSITNYLKQIQDRINFYKKQNPKEIVLIGHSMGGFVAIIAGNRIKEVTKIISLCPPSDRYYSDKEWPENSFKLSKRDLPDNPKKFINFNIPYSFFKNRIKYSARDEVKKINKPLMIFIALDDIVVPPELTEEIVINANNPHVIRQKKMGHNFRRSSEETNVVADEIEKFLK